MSEATALVRIQDIDLALIRHKKAAEALPQRAKVAAARAASKKVAGELTKILGQRKDVEIELADLEEDKKYYASQVEVAQQDAADTSNYKVMQEIQEELTHLAKRIEKCDFDSERLMERLEVVERAEKNARALLAKLEAEEASLTQSWKDAAADITAQVQELSDERKQLVAEVSPELMVRYDAAKKRFGGVAVETLTGNRPSACRVALQPSSYSDIRRNGGEVTTCPYCKRLLVVSQEA